MIPTNERTGHSVLLGAQSWNMTEREKSGPLMELVLSPHWLEDQKNGSGRVKEAEEKKQKYVWWVSKACLHRPRVWLVPRSKEDSETEPDWEWVASNESFGCLVLFLLVFRGWSVDVSTSLPYDGWSNTETDIAMSSTVSGMSWRAAVAYCCRVKAMELIFLMDALFHN